MKKEIRSSKWAFLLYKDSAPKDYFNKLEGLHVLFILSLQQAASISGN